MFICLLTKTELEERERGNPILNEEEFLRKHLVA
jgi:hypothetical protein